MPISLNRLQWLVLKKWLVKSIITGIFWAIWHLLIFNNFSQFCGFAGFMLLCIVFSFVLTFLTIRTNSIIAPATLHALLGKTNLVTVEKSTGA